MDIDGCGIEPGMAQPLFELKRAHARLRFGRGKRVTKGVRRDPFGDPSLFTIFVQ